jgi:enamine deaminase RidA (YjgF/YER057c/UK114 family)
MSIGKSPDDRIAELGLRFPPLMKPAGTFVHVVTAPPFIFAGGHFPVTPEGRVVQGKLGADLSVEEGYAAAQLAALSMLGNLREALGRLDRIACVLKLNGVINATPDFAQHTHVINGASDVLVSVFGDEGQHARLAVGVSSLPFNLALEIEATLLLR